MAITSLSQVKDGIRPPIIFYITSSSGSPSNSLGTEIYFNSNSTTGGGIAVTSPSQIAYNYYKNYSFTNPSSGSTAYLAGVTATAYKPTSSTFGSSIILHDILWLTGADSSGVSLSVGTSPQTINSVQWPARDNNGSTDGEGVYAGIVINSNFGTTGDTTSTITYTNSLGVGNRTGTAILPGGIDTAFDFFSLQEGDTGVRSIQNFQFAADHVSGTIRLVAIRPIAFIPTLTASLTKLDAINLCLPKLYDNSIIGGLQIRPSGTEMAYTLYVTHG